LFYKKMCEYVFKILLVGDMGVGKSALSSRFMQDRFFLTYYPTVGIDFNVSDVEVSGKRVFLQIWDSAGQERFHALLPNYYRNSHGVIIVYDTTSRSSFRNVSNWLKEASVFCPKKVSLMLVGNKCDELEKRQVPQEKAVRYAEHHGLSFSEASAKSGANVRDIFENFAVDVYDRLVLAIKRSPTNRSRKVDSKDSQQDKDEDKDHEANAGNILVLEKNKI
ncbi:hypothetical protein KR054_011732, partial [Drosophila jambulina]